MKNLNSSQEGHNWLLTFCPATGAEVVAHGWRKQTLPSNREAIWWKCPACHGLHLTTLNPEDQEEDLLH